MYNNISLNDGTILKIESIEFDIYLTYQNWKEEINTIIFIDAIYLEVLNAIKAESGDLSVETDDQKIFEICEKIEEPAANYKLFKIFSAWNWDNKLIEVIAKDVKAII